MRQVCACEAKGLVTCDDDASVVPPSEVCENASACFAIRHLVYGACATSSELFSSVVEDSMAGISSIVSAGLQKGGLRWPPHEDSEDAFKRLFTSGALRSCHAACSSFPSSLQTLLVDKLTAHCETQLLRWQNHVLKAAKESRNELFNWFLDRDISRDNMAWYCFLSEETWCNDPRLDPQDFLRVAHQQDVEFDQILVDRGIT